MSKNLDGIVAAIRDKRTQKRPEVEKNLQKIDALLGALRDTLGRASAVASRYPDLAAELSGVSSRDAEKHLLEARTACEAALTRLLRDSINIGVAAKAGQGKSQLLQMLTGLGNEQIPTGGGGACTAVRSIVHNSPTQKAIVHYLTPNELLEKKVYPSYKPADKSHDNFAIGHARNGLKIEEKPTSLDAFLSADLPAIEPADDLPTQGVTNWNENVRALQRDLNASPELKLLLGKAPEEISIDDVRSFLVKDNNEKKHNVVAFVEMWTPFEVGLPNGLTVYDLPGLEDPTPGIREDMLKSVKTDADVVFFLLKPPTNGERTLWQPADNAATDMLQEVYPVDEVKPADWVQLILNEDKREGHKNGGSINLLLGKNADGTPSETGRSKIPRGFSPVVCDCGSKDAVRDMVDANIDALVSKVSYIDNRRISQADKAVATARGEATLLLNRLRSLTFDIAVPDFDLDDHVNDFMSALRGPLREEKLSGYFTNDLITEIKESLTKHFSIAKTKLNEFYMEFAEKETFPAEFPIFSIMELHKLIQRRSGAVGPLEDAVRNQREAILKLLRDQLSLCCSELRDGYYSLVAKHGFSSNEALKNIVFVDIESASDKRVYLTQFLSALRKSGSFPWLESALESLLHFDLDFDNTILPWIYGIDHFADFDPDYSPKKNKNSETDSVETSGESDTQMDKKGREFRMVKTNIADKGSFRDQADYIFGWMQQKTIMIAEELTSPAERKEKLLNGISIHVARTMEANYDSFVYRFIWGKTVEKEWKRFADENKTVFWRKEYEEKAAKSQLKKDWDNALSPLSDALADSH